MSSFDERGIWMRLRITGAALGCLLVAIAAPLGAAAQELPGVTDTEIRIGNTYPYTGPAAAWGIAGRVYAAYFRMINDQGGINGRQITFISYDDGYSPPRTVEQTRRLVEGDDVLLMFQSLGTLPNLAVRQYLNDAGVPQLFIATQNTQFDDPSVYPWTMRWNWSSHLEAKVYAAHLRDSFNTAIVGILYENNDFGQDFLTAFTEYLGEEFPVVAQPYAITDPTVDAQIAALQSAGVDVLVNVAGVRHAPMALRRAAELQWRPYHILVSVSSSVAGVLAPAGLDNAVGAVTAFAWKAPSNPAWANDSDIIEFNRFIDQYFPEGDPNGNFEAYAYGVASALVEVLRRCGDDLSRENVMGQATSLADVELPLLLPGVVVNTSQTDYSPLEQLQMHRFDGEYWIPFGPVFDLGGDS